MPPEQAAAPAEAPAAAPVADAASFILVVEDDPVLKNLLGHTFAGKYQTLYASDGPQALALAEQYKPRMILLDLVLPGMSGFDILEKIRASASEIKNVPVLIVSNLGQQKDKDHAKELGATDYMVKADSSVDEIVAKMESLLTSQQHS